MSKDIFAQREMYLTVTGTGESVCAGLSRRSSRRLMWVSAARDADGNPLRTRVPEPGDAEFTTREFTAAGKRYASTDELTRTESDGLFTDLHGRTVVCVTERFPCFDSYDYLYENRYYRWWLIIQPDSITRVYAEDERGTIHVTEDVLDLEADCAEVLKNLGLITQEENGK